MNPADPYTVRPARWAIVLAFALVYVCWGTTYLAIRVGVQSFPPALFGGTRIAFAGVVMLLFLAVRRESLTLSWTEFLWSALTAFFLFVLGNGLITAGERTVESGVASVLVATTPIWAALIEMCWPHGDRLTARGWLGLFIGLGGVCLLVSDRLGKHTAALGDPGTILVITSSMAWAVGASILRHRRRHNAQFSTTAYQMIIGGLGLATVGVAFGEIDQLNWENVTPGAVYSFFHLLIFGSLVGYVAYVWLLKHVSVTKAATYAYVNPVVALIVGCAIGDEPFRLATVGGMVIVLAGVALVRTGERPGRTETSDDEAPRSKPATVPATHYPHAAPRLECPQRD
jgi:drug/metabolite transporter (DMT)-like permease